MSERDFDAEVKADIARDELERLRAIETAARNVISAIGLWKSHSGEMELAVSDETCSFSDELKALHAALGLD